MEKSKFTETFQGGSAIDWKRFQRESKLKFTPELQAEAWRILPVL
jgi:hypothetical protein